MVVLLIIAQLVVVVFVVVVVVVVKGSVIVVICIEGISTEFIVVFNEILLHLNVMNLSELIIKTLSSSSGDEELFEFKLEINDEESGSSLVEIVVIKPNGCCWFTNSLKSFKSGDCGINLKSILHNGNSFVAESFE